EGSRPEQEKMEALRQLCLLIADGGSSSTKMLNQVQELLCQNVEIANTALKSLKGVRGSWSEENAAKVGGTVSSTAEIKSEGHKRRDPEMEKERYKEMRGFIDQLIAAISKFLFGKNSSGKRRMGFYDDFEVGLKKARAALPLRAQDDINIGV